MLYDASHPLVQEHLRQEEQRAAKRRAYLREHRPSLFIDLDLVEIVPEPTSASARSLSDRIVPGSVLVAHHDAEDGTCRVDYEGGIHMRQPDRAPTPEERETYAKCAAGRAAEEYPTVARVYCILRADLRVIGRINPGEGTIVWHAGT